MKKLLIPLMLLAFSMASAQEWTVIELPANLADMPQLVEDRFDCTYQELPEKYNLSHVRFTGTDFDRSDNNSNGKQALAALVKKAKVIDLAQVKDNETTKKWYADRPNYDYPGPEMIVQFVNSGAKDSLEHFIFPKTLSIINNNLSGRNKLKQVTWPDHVEKICNNMFTSCEALEQITLPNGITEIPKTCFQRCYSLKSVTVPDGVKTFAPEAFMFCSVLENVNVPDGVETIGYDCFTYNFALKNIDLPASITTIEYLAFQRCTSLEHIILPPRLKAIGGRTFNECKNLRSIVIPDSVTSIGEYAFANDDSLKSITLPNGLTSIDRFAFYGTSLVEFDMPDAVTTLGTGLFEACKQLRKVHLSRQLTTIPDRTFINCEALEEINIPTGIVTIGQNAFNGCISLPNMTLHEGVIKIDNNAFKGLHFEQITLPTTLQFIGDESFRACRLRSIDIPTNVIEIGSSAFADCDSLRHATLPDGLLFLKDYAFGNCSKLTDVALPSTLRYLGESVFQYNRSKKSYVQPPLINVVPANVCQECDSLVSVTLHDGVTKINSRAFWRCKQLTHIDLPQSLQTIRERAFAEIPITEISIPSSVRTIENLAFDSGDYSRVVVPEGVTYIGTNAFYGSKLSYIDFPSTLNVLEEQSFKFFGSLDSIVLRSPLPPVGSGRIPKYDMGPVYVPPITVATYKSNSRFYYSNNIYPLTGYSPQNVVVATTLSTDSTWFPVINDANLHIAHNDTKAKGQLHVGKDTNWPVNHLRFDYYKPYNDNESLIPSLIIDGTLTAQSMEMNLSNLYPGGWFYFTPPFDMKASDLTCSDPRTPWVLRTFDGAQRAAGNHQRVWQNVPADATLEAGRAYIMQYGEYRLQQGYDDWTSIGYYQNTDFHFISLTPLRTLALTSNDVTIPLQEFKGEYPHNEGWNLVGNPFMAYFDIRQLDTDGPILIPSGSGKRSFTAYSPLDDEYILRPIDGFLVQRSNTQTAITFHPEGRQPNLTIRHDNINNSRSIRRQQLCQQRVVYDVMLSHLTEQAGLDNLMNRTRVVLTPRATDGYDCGYDAPFITMDDSITTFYSRTAGLAYCLNELPPTANSVQLCMHLQEAGTYKISINLRGTTSLTPRHLWLKDRETGEKTDMLTNAYSFTVNEPCTLNNRFLLLFNDGITSVEPVTTSKMQSRQYYDLQGRPVSNPTKGIYIKKGKKYIQ